MIGIGIFVGTLGFGSAVSQALPWLQQHIGKQSAKIETSVTRGTFGATFIDCGVPEGYINQRIHQLSEAARTACNGNIVYWG
jgi:hypothetical protein